MLMLHLLLCRIEESCYGCTATDEPFLVMLTKGTWYSLSLKLWGKSFKKIVFSYLQFFFLTFVMPIRFGDLWQILAHSINQHSQLNT